MSHQTFRNFYAVTEENDGTVTLEIQDSDSGLFESFNTMTVAETERLAFDLIAAARRQMDASTPTEGSA